NGALGSVKEWKLKDCVAVHQLLVATLDDRTVALMPRGLGDVEEGLILGKEDVKEQGRVIGEAGFVVDFGGNSVIGLLGNFSRV
ncbi:hypothetical protein Tco_0360224, partial [Tanacetum coccineum]